MDEIELVKATKDRDREEIAFDLDLKAVKPCFIPKYGYNEGHRPQYQPLSLNRLQYLIDLGRIDPTQPIDLTQLVNGRAVTVQPLKRDYGVQLVEEMDRLLLMQTSTQQPDLLQASIRHSNHGRRLFVFSTSCPHS